MSFRDVEDLLAERGIIVSYETVRQWCGKFGPDYARQLRRRSSANLHAFRTANPCIAEGLLWASLAAALLKRFVAHVTELVVRGVEISTRNAAMAFRYKAPELFRAVLHRASY